MKVTVIVERDGDIATLTRNYDDPNELRDAIELAAIIDDIVVDTVVGVKGRIEIDASFENKEDE